MGLKERDKGELMLDDIKLIADPAPLGAPEDAAGSVLDNILAGSDTALADGAGDGSDEASGQGDASAGNDTPVEASLIAADDNLLDGSGDTNVVDGGSTGGSMDGATDVGGLPTDNVSTGGDPSGFDLHTDFVFFDGTGDFLPAPGNDHGLIPIDIVIMPVIDPIFVDGGPICTIMPIDWVPDGSGDTPPDGVFRIAYPTDGAGNGDDAKDFPPGGDVVLVVDPAKGDDASGAPGSIDGSVPVDGGAYPDGDCTFDLVVDVPWDPQTGAVDGTDGPQIAFYPTCIMLPLDMIG